MTRRIEGHPVSREALARTVRLVSTARLREAVLRALADTDAEFELLARLDQMTSGRAQAMGGGLPALPPEDLVARVPHAAFVNAAFAYSLPRGLNRFNGPGRGAWYAALAVETALAEVAFHMTRHLSETSRMLAVVEYAEMFASFAGEFLDLRGAPPGTAALHPDPAAGYAAGNALAAATMAEGLNGIIYPSVRDEGGTCAVALWPHAVQSPAQGGVWRLSWTGSPTPRRERVAG